MSLFTMAKAAKAAKIRSWKRRWLEISKRLGFPNQRMQGAVLRLPASGSLRRLGRGHDLRRPGGTPCQQHRRTQQQRGPQEGRAGKSPLRARADEHSEYL